MTIPRADMTDFALASARAFSALEAWDSTVIFVSLTEALGAAKQQT